MPPLQQDGSNLNLRQRRKRLMKLKEYAEKFRQWLDSGEQIDVEKEPRSPTNSAHE
jgi:hypothetical protein